MFRETDPIGRPIELIMPAKGEDLTNPEKKLKPNQKPPEQLDEPNFSDILIEELNNIDKDKPEPETE